MEGESQPADEVREEYYPLPGFRGRDDLPFGRKPMRDLCGHVSGHPLASRSGHVRNVFAGKAKAWVLELENG